MISIEFINLIIKRSALDRVYAGGSAKFILDNEPFDGYVRAYDESLVKFGAMNPNDIQVIAKHLESIGLVGISKKNDEELWVDFCVVDELMGATLACDWIHYDRESRSASILMT
jgi:hypothetical protein